MHSEMCINVTFIWWTLIKGKTALLLHQLFLHKGHKCHSCPLNSKQTHKSHTPEHHVKSGHGPALEYTPKDKWGQRGSVCYQRCVRMSMDGKINTIKLNKWQRSLVPCTAGLAWLKVDLADSEWLSLDSRNSDSLAIWTQNFEFSLNSTWRNKRLNL